MTVDAHVDVTTLTFRSDYSFAPGTPVSRQLHLTPFGVRLPATAGTDASYHAWSELLSVQAVGMEVVLTGRNGAWLGSMNVLEPAAERGRMVSLINDYILAFRGVEQQPVTLDPRLDFLRTEGVVRDGG